MLVLLLLQAALFALHAAAQNFTNSTVPSNGTNSTTPSPTSPNYPLTTDGSCGNQAGFMCLTNGTSPCCSSSGYCGNDDAYCGSGCQSDFGECTPNPATLGNPPCSWADTGDSPRCDGRCGTAYNGAKCATDWAPNALEMYGVYEYGKCCASAGFCGSTDNHCNPANQCQSGCNTTNSSTTASSAPAATSKSAGSSTRTAVSSSGGIFAFGVSLFGVAYAIL